MVTVSLNNPIFLRGIKTDYFIKQAIMLYVSYINHGKCRAWFSIGSDT